jgi:pyrophosphatase PpaX
MENGREPRPQSLRAVLFDLDGTLLDSERVDVQAMGRVIREHLGLEMDDREVASYRNIPSREVLKQLAPAELHREEELLAAWLVYQMELLPETRLFPGILHTLRVLSQAGLALGVVTGQSRSELAATRQHVMIDDLIDVWVSVDDAPLAKPDPASVRVALDALGCPSARAIMIGDSRFDLEAGRAAGTWVGVALWGLSDALHAPLLSYQPDYVFQYPQELVGKLGIGRQERRYS